MIYFSMFSGIGGFEYGIIRAYEQIRKNNLAQYSNGIEKRSKLQLPTCVGYSEIDKYAIQIYQKHFGGHKNYGNAKGIIPEEILDFDLLVAGFPCQGFSIAGKRGGFEDTRGTLFYEIPRIAKVKRPKLLLLENVKGLLSHDKGKTFGTILATFSKLGYVLEWQILNSKNFGVPQNRERVFIIGYLGRESFRQVFPIRESDEVFNKPNKRKQGEEIIATTIRPGQGGLPGNSESYIGRYPLKFLSRNQKNIEGDYAFTIDGANTGGVKQDMKIRRLTPTECERLQGFPDGWTEGVSDSQRYKCLGNAVTVNVIQAIMERLI